MTSEPRRHLQRQQLTGRRAGFDRDRFLLRLVAGIFLAQFALYAIGLAGCLLLRLRQQQPLGGACSSYPAHLQRAFETALATALALLGGSSLALSQQRRQQPGDPHATVSGDAGRVSDRPL